MANLSQYLSSTAGKIASQGDEYANAAAAQYGNAVATAQSGLNKILSLGGQTQTDLESGRNAAADVSDSIDKVNASAGEVKAAANAMAPYASTLSGYGDDLWKYAQSVLGTGTDILNAGNGLLNLDPTSSGVGGEYVKLYNALSGDNQVSMAASDIQSSYQNAGDQARRNLARRGVSSSSGAAQTLERQYAQALATALAAAKTRARKSAISDQAEMLGNITNAANSIIGSGNTTLNTGDKLAESAISAKGKAADVQGDIASQLASAGQLYASAGSLRVGQANAYTNVAGTNNSYLNALNTAYSNVTNATQGYANFLGDIAGGFYSFALQESANSASASATNSESKNTAPSINWGKIANATRSSFSVNGKSYGNATPYINRFK